MHFIAPEPNMIAFVGLIGTGIVGHALIDLQNWGGTTMATVLQYKVDRPVPPRVLQSCYSRVVEWAEARGAAGIQILAANEQVARVFRRYYGFERHRILMRRPLNGAMAGSPSKANN